jgi:hypothetical protein
MSNRAPAEQAKKPTSLREAAGSIEQSRVHQIAQRGRTLPEGADEFVAFLKTYFASWAARSGVT